MESASVESGRTSQRAHEPARTPPAEEVTELRTARRGPEGSQRHEVLKSVHDSDGRFWPGNFYLENYDVW